MGTIVRVRKDTGDNSDGLFFNREAVEARLIGHAIGRGRVTFMIERTDDAEGARDPVMVILSVNVVAAADSTPATAVGTIGDIQVPTGTGAVGEARVMNISRYFVDGDGPGGAVKSYDQSASPADVVTVEVEDDGEMTVRAVADVAAGMSARITITAVDDVADTTSNPAPTQSFYVYVRAAADISDVVGDATFATRSNNPGSGTRYDLSFKTTAAMNTLVDEVVIELADFTVPSSVGVNSIAITVKDTATIAADDDASPPVDAVDEDRTTIPEDVSVSGEKLFITIGDLNKDRTGSGATGGENADFGITSGSTISVVIRESAGVSNPSAAGGYGPVIEIESSSGVTIADYDFEAENDDGDPEYPELTMSVYRVVSLDEEDGGLGTVVTVTGKGFRKSTSMIVFVDHPSHQDDDDDPDTDAKDDDDVRGTDPMVRGHPGPGRGCAVHGPGYQQCQHRLVRIHGNPPDFRRRH